MCFHVRWSFDMLIRLFGNFLSSVGPAHPLPPISQCAYLVKPFFSFASAVTQGYKEYQFLISLSNYLSNNTGFSPSTPNKGREHEPHRFGKSDLLLWWITKAVWTAQVILLPGRAASKYRAVKFSFSFFIFRSQNLFPFSFFSSFSSFSWFFLFFVPVFVFFSRPVCPVFFSE